MRLILPLCAFCLAGLAACDEADQAQSQNIEDDWVHNPAPNTPAPEPTPPAEDVYTGPAEVGKYVLKFIEDAGRKGLDVLPDMQDPKLDIRIASLDSWGSSTIGLCETGSNRRRVTFDPDFWNAVSETQKELLAHHELGHCVLYRGHRTALLETGKYASIMYPIIMGTSTYQNNYDYYQEELFTWNALEMADKLARKENVHICDHEDM